MGCVRSKPKYKIPTETPIHAPINREEVKAVDNEANIEESKIEEHKSEVHLPRQRENPINPFTAFLENNDNIDQVIDPDDPLNQCPICHIRFISMSTVNVNKSTENGAYRDVPASPTCSFAS